MRCLEALKSSSPDTYVLLVTNPCKKTFPLVFQRLFVYFYGLKKGWLEVCRKLICVDACFLKTFLGGQLLADVGMNSNDKMYPRSWVVVEGENNDSWEWFFIKLQKCLGLDKGNGAALISNEHQVIINVVVNVLSHAKRRQCARHIFSN